jgi:integrase
VVQRVKGGGWRAQVRVGGKIRGHRWTRKEDAQAEERELMREKELIRAGLEAPSKNVLLIDYANTWLNRRKQSKPRSTWEKDEARLRIYILPVFGARPLSLIKIAEWKDFFDALGSVHKLSQATRNRVRALLHRLYREAMEDRVAAQNPISLIRLHSEKKKTRPRLHWETAAEVDAYLAAMREEKLPGYYQLALLLLNTGMRRGEAIAVSNGDVYLRRGLIRVRQIFDPAEGEIVERTKAGEAVERWVPINAPVRAMLEARKVVSASWPVCHHGKGKPVSPWAFRDAHERAITRAGVKRIEVHHLRRTFATHFIANGGTFEALQQILGHSSVLVTQQYVGETPDFTQGKTDIVAFSGVTTVSPVNGTDGAAQDG